MLSNEALKEKLHNYIEIAEYKKLQAIYLLLENEIDSTYSPEDIDMFHERSEAYKIGKSESYSVEESMKAVREQRN